jgi:hypothetical protein
MDGERRRINGTLVLSDHAKRGCTSRAICGLRDIEGRGLPHTLRSISS